MGLRHFMKARAWSIDANYVMRHGEPTFPVQREYGGKGPGWELAEKHRYSGRIGAASSSCGIAVSDRAQRWSTTRAIAFLFFVRNVSGSHNQRSLSATDNGLLWRTSGPAEQGVHGLQSGRSMSSLYQTRTQGWENVRHCTKRPPEKKSRTAKQLESGETLVDFCWGSGPSWTAKYLREPTNCRWTTQKRKYQKNHTYTNQVNNHK